ncbi:MAG: SGNH/GDSL hydrolase family protein [Pirellulales bacterium]
MDRLFVLSSAGLLLLVSVLAAGGPTRRWMGRQWTGLLACAVATVGTWLLVEPVAARWLPDNQKSFHLWSRSSQFIFRPIPEIMPGISGESRFTVNSLGIRGPELPERSVAYRILCVGGSTTECLYLDDAESWPHLLAARLNESRPEKPVWVGNIGRSGFSTPHHLKFIQESPLIEEIDCVMLLVGYNDLSRLLCGELGHQLWADDREKQPLWRHSNMLAMLRAIRQDWMEGCVIIEDESGRNYELRRRERQQGPFSDAMPDATATLAEYRQRLEAIAKTCREKKVRVVFVTQPTIWADGLSSDIEALMWGGQLATGQYLKGGKIREGLDNYNKVLEGTCTEWGVECVSLGSMNDKTEWFYDHAHFNEAGARAVARLVSDHFLNETKHELSN